MSEFKHCKRGHNVGVLKYKLHTRELLDINSKMWTIFDKMDVITFVIEPYNTDYAYEYETGNLFEGRSPKISIIRGSVQVILNEF